MTKKTLLKKYRRKLIRRYQKMDHYMKQGQGGGVVLMEKEIKFIEKFIKELKRIK